MLEQAGLKRYEVSNFSVPVIPSCTIHVVVIDLGSKSSSCMHIAGTEASIRNVTEYGY